MTDPIHPYSSLRYAEGLNHIGRPVAVPEWGTSVLVRRVPGGGEDATGIYPLTSLASARDLGGGLERLRRLGLISVALVPDPLGEPPRAILAEAFSPVRAFKSHLTIDPDIGAYSPSRHHAERIRRGLRRCSIESGALEPWMDDWLRLYQGLIAHRGITGAAAFPGTSFRALAEEPALVAFAARVGDQTVGMTVWFAHGGVVYNHLTAVDAAGYAAGASYALYDSAIRHFQGQGIVNLGGGAGAGAGDGGLFEFKRGFANSEVEAVICGAVLDPQRYAALGGNEVSAFFPAYRAPI